MAFSSRHLDRKRRSLFLPSHLDLVVCFNPKYIKTRMLWAGPWESKIKATIFASKPSIIAAPVMGETISSTKERSVAGYLKNWLSLIAKAEWLLWCAHSSEPWALS
jgi:hypothetical protein